MRETYSPALPLSVPRITLENHDIKNKQCLWRNGTEEESTILMNSEPLPVRPAAGFVEWLGY